MNQLKTFDKGELHVSVLIIDGKEFFPASEVASLLGYSNPRDAIARHCKSDGVVNHDIIDSMNRVQTMNFITEGNLYRLISRSKLPSAEKFETWVFDEVLPSIRKNGMYAKDDLLDNPDLLLEVVTKLKAEKDQNKLLLQKIEEDKSKVLFADAVADSKSTVLIGSLAKILKQNGFDIGQNRLFEWMRENGYLIRRHGDEYNAPTQKAMDMQLFTVKKVIITDAVGNSRTCNTTKVTGKGQIYFINKFREQEAFKCK